MTFPTRAIGDIFIFFALTLALSACETPATTPSAPDEAQACTRLSDEFVAIARKRDAGQSRRTQVEHSYEVAVDPATADPEGTIRYLLQAIDFVYGRPEMNAEGVGALVLSSCLVNDEGRAVLYLPQP